MRLSDASGAARGPAAAGPKGGSRAWPDGTGVTGSTGSWAKSSRGPVPGLRARESLREARRSAAGAHSASRRRPAPTCHHTGSPLSLGAAVSGRARAFLVARTDPADSAASTRPLPTPCRRQGAVVSRCAAAHATGGVEDPGRPTQIIALLTSGRCFRTCGRSRGAAAARSRGAGVSFAGVPQRTPSAAATSPRAD